MARLALAIAFAIALPRVSCAAQPLAQEALGWLRQYLQIDTTNPPGETREAAELLARILEAEGVGARLYDSPEGRTSLFARLEGGEGTLLLVHHLDVVPAGDGWRGDPFSGRPLEGEIWGRGAVDDKSLGIAQLAAVIDLLRRRVPLRKSVALLAVADEEAGGQQGAAWMLQAHPELFADVDAVLGEGGTNRVLQERVVWWGIEVAQKRPLWVRLTARGRGGHASGFHPASAAHTLLRGLSRLVDRPPSYRVTPEARRFLGELARLEGSPPGHLYERLDEVIQGGRLLGSLPPGMPVFFVDTLQVTELAAAEGRNVVAPIATASLDIRLLPDSDAEAVLADVRRLVGPEVTAEALVVAPPSPPSPTDHPLFQTLRDVLSVNAPVVPVFIPGTTDSRFFRARGIPAYGFAPFALEPQELRGIHGTDERLPADAFLRGMAWMSRVVRAYCAAEGG